jgi:hypothetical protein
MDQYLVYMDSANFDELGINLVFFSHLIVSYHVNHPRFHISINIFLKKQVILTETYVF